MSQRQDSAPHAGHRQRVRARLLSEGPDAMAPHELLEFILFYAIPKRDVNPLAHRLIDRFGSLGGVLAADESELRAVDGMGAAAAPVLLYILTESFLSAELLGAITAALVALICLLLYHWLKRRGVELFEKI